MLSLVKSVDYRYIYRSVGMVQFEFILNAVNDNAYPGNLIYKVRKIIIPTEVPVNFVLTILPA